MKTMLYVVAHLLAAIALWAEPASAVVCETGRGVLFARETCLANENVADTLRLCARPGGRLAARGTCTSTEIETDGLKGSLCAAKNGVLTQRTRCRPSELAIDAASLCAQPKGRVRARHSCRTSELLVADIRLSLPVAQSFDPAVGILPYNARVILSDPGVVQAIEGWQCGRISGKSRLRSIKSLLGDFDTSITIGGPPSGVGMVELEGEWVLPNWADQATVFLNGWQVSYGNKDHHVRAVSASIRPSLRNGVLEWNAAARLADQGYDDEIAACIYYTAIGWDSTDIDARPVLVERDLGNVAVSQSTGKGIRVQDRTYTGPTTSAGTPAALLPRGFSTAYMSDDKHVFRMGYSLSQDEDRSGRNGVHWTTRGELRDNTKEHTVLDSYETLLLGSSVTVRTDTYTIPQPSPCVDNVASTCLASGENHGVHQDVFREELPEYDYVIPMLTSFDLGFATGDQHVKSAGAWLDRIDFRHQSGVLTYRVSTVLRDKNDDPGFRSDHAVTLLGLTRRSAPPLPGPRPGPISCQTNPELCQVQDSGHLFDGFRKNSFGNPF